MSKEKYEYEDIDLVNLLLDIKNPRFETQHNQREALRTIAIEQGQKLVKLAEHIAQNDTNPSEMPIVINSSDKGYYTVLEGNRRVAAIKLCSEPKLVDSLKLPTSIARRLKSLNQEYGSSLPVNLHCTVAPSRKKARMWIELRHTGENAGVGIISWNGIAASRFRGESPESQLLEIVKDSDFLDDETRDKLARIPITNLQRLINTPDARHIIGMDIINKQLIFLNPDEKTDAVGRMAIVVNDIANKHIKVTQLDTKDQRVGYATAVAARDLPTPGKKIAPTDLTGQVTPAKERTKKKKGNGASRKTLIPKSLRLNIAQPRMTRIFDELKRLKVNDFENSSAVLLRVFMEMSVNEFARIKRISLREVRTDKDGKKTQRDLPLKKKVARIVDYLVDKDASSKRELHGIRTLVSSRDTIFSISNWQEYVHNQHYNPIASDLIRIWDNIQPFFQKVWA